MHLTDEQITTKLIQVGLPQHGTREERIALLVRMGIIEGEKPKENRAYKTEDGRIIIDAPNGVRSKDQADELAKQAVPIEEHPAYVAPKRMGRPPKVQ